MMKKLLALTCAACLGAALLSGCSGDTSSTSSGSGTDSTSSTQSLSGTVKTGGSTSVEKVMNALIYQFQNDNRDVTVNYEMNGSGDGIKNTLSGMYEIGHSSRELKTDGSEDGLTATPYAIDGIAVVTHKDNPVKSLTQQQIFDIYTGKITNWKEVGGNDAIITLVTREASSGTRAAFTEIIGLNKEDSDGNIDPDTQIAANATECKDTGAVQTTVSSNPNAIGYMSFSDVDDTKVNAVEYEGVAISNETLKDGSYKLKREFLLVTKEGAELSAAAQGFIDFILSDAGQGIVADNNLLPIK